MKTYEKYKPSGIEWIGDIPEHWKVNKLKFLTKVNSTALAEKQKEDFTIKYIDISSVNSNGEIIQTADYLFSESPSRARRIVKANDTIVSTVRTYLKAIAFIEKDIENLICSTGFAVIRPDEDIKGKFLFSVCFSNYFIEAVVSLSKGVSYPAIDSEDVKNILIWIPTLPEQTAIADYLDEKTEEIDKLIANKKRLIELLKEERTAIINKAVTKGINADAKLKSSGIDWLGDIPDHWEVKKLKYVATIKGRIGFRGYNVSDVVGYGEGALTIGGKHISKDNKINLSNPEFLSWDKFYESPEIEVHKGQILVVQRGTIGKVALVEEDLGKATINPSLLILKNFKTDPFYLINYFNSVCFTNFIELISSGTAVPMISQEQLGKFELLIPPENEQKEIVEFIESKTNEIDSTISKIEKEIELIKEYRTALISEVVTGKIKVVEENEYRCK